MCYGHMEAGWDLEAGSRGADIWQDSSKEILELRCGWKEGARNVKVENECPRQRQEQVQKWVQRSQWNFVTD